MRRNIENVIKFIDDHIVVVQASRQPFLLEGNPDISLKDPYALLTPGFEEGSKDRQFLFKGFNGRCVDEIEYGCVASLSLNSRSESIRRVCEYIHTWNMRTLPTEPSDSSGGKTFLMPSTTRSQSLV